MNSRQKSLARCSQEVETPRGPKATSPDPASIKLPGGPDTAKSRFLILLRVREQLLSILQYHRILQTNSSHASPNSKAPIICGPSVWVSFGLGLGHRAVSKPDFFGGGPHVRDAERMPIRRVETLVANTDTMCDSIMCGGVGGGPPTSLTGIVPYSPSAKCALYTQNYHCGSCDRSLACPMFQLLWHLVAWRSCRYWTKPAAC